ncbi:MAG: AzlC family ABC transporter permease, partial [Rhodobacteraceae bacterium]|nr:AzlC family ABC transporter permease [Paracoccaceae bacterium]
MPPAGVSAAPRPTFAAGLAAALPIALGYLPIAFSFGVAATRAGLTAAEATALSLLVYAGASQFLALAFLGSGAPLPVAVLTLV